jgi:large subunit ribosomal protein L1
MIFGVGKVMPINKGEILKAINEAKQNSKKRKFIQSIEIILSLRDIDVKKPENRINELIELPYSPSQKIKVMVCATGDLAIRAKNAGADVVIDKEALTEILNDKKRARNLVKGMDFFIAETTLMPLIGRALGSILGPKGKMPTPIPPTAPIDDLIARRRKTVQMRVRDQHSAQCKVGSEDMESKLIAENIQTVLTRLETKLEKGLKNIREAYVKTTMGLPTKIVL